MTEAHSLDHPILTTSSKLTKLLLTLHVTFSLLTSEVSAYNIINTLFPDANVAK
jgi:hypothetical protein